MDTVCRERAKVGLNARAAAGVGTRDRQHGRRAVAPNLHVAGPQQARFSVYSVTRNPPAKPVICEQDKGLSIETCDRYLLTRCCIFAKLPNE
jgi:hypothetical protein